MNYPPYPDYYADALDGREPIPSGWEPIRLRRILQLNPLVPSVVRRSTAEVTFLPMEAIGEDGFLDMSRERPVQELLAGYSYFENGDVLFAKVTPCFENGKFAAVEGLSSGFGFGTTEVTTLRPGSRLDQRFLCYLVRTDRFRQSGIAAMTGAGGLKRVPDEHVRSFQLGLPPVDEQRAIADFLDRETAKIDALIAKQEQLIATLREDRIATITHAVTKGLDPNAEMKDSGVEWLGEIPAHWEIDRLKWSINSCQNGIWGEDPDGGCDDIRCIRVADFDRANLTIADGDVTFRKVTTRERHLRELRYGDLILEKSGGGEKNPVGFVVLFDKLESAVTSNFLARMSLSHDMVSKYWLYVHASMYRSRLTQRSIKQTSGIQNLDQESYFNERCCYPPVDEQHHIVEHLDSHCAKLDALIAKSKKMIGVLREYRSALITDAVTGKIDVRGAA